MTRQKPLVLCLTCKQNYMHASANISRMEVSEGPNSTTSLPLKTFENQPAELCKAFKMIIYFHHHLHCVVSEEEILI